MLKEYTFGVIYFLLVRRTRILLMDISDSKAERLWDWSELAVLDASRGIRGGICTENHHSVVVF